MAMKHGTRYGIRSLDDLRDRCRVDADTGCWNWSMAISENAPRVWAWNPDTGRCQAMRGTTAAWRIAGKPIPPKCIVYRTCSSIPCCNPEHMRCGTKVEAGAFFAASGRLKGDPVARANRGRVGREHRGKLTRSDRAMIDESSETNVALAAVIGVAHTTVSAYRRGKTWRPLLPTASVFEWARAA